MKIQHKTKLYGYIFKELFLFVNSTLYFLFRYFETKESNNLRYLWVLIPLAIFTTVFAVFDYRNYDRRTEYRHNIMTILFFAVSTFFCIASFVLKIKYGIILLCCFLGECAIIPVIEYRWRIVNKIKAYFKKKQNDK